MSEANVRFALEVNPIEVPFAIKIRPAAGEVIVELTPRRP